MVKNAIQEERMKSYFIEATKEILKGEGLKSVNVRSVAQKAGYSFATIYNYFRDVKDLVFECVKYFLDECENTIKNETETVPNGKEKIKAITKSYVKYFVQYPGIFELLFIEKPNDLAGKQTTIEMIDKFFDQLYLDEWMILVKKGVYTLGQIELKNNQLKYGLLGLLLMYLNRKQPKTYSEFNKLLDTQLNEIVS